MPVSNGWKLITPELLEALPDRQGVFELGSLVRSVVFIGGDADAGLRSMVREALAEPRLRMRARCLRFELTDDPRGRANQLVAEYRAAHGGALPAEQPRGSAPLLSLSAAPVEGRVTRPRLQPARAATDCDPSFLRIRTVA
jgi:hypothetical protein